MIGMRLTANSIDKKMQRAESYEQWAALAQQHDALTGGKAWREVERSRLYDYQAIRFRLDRLRGLREQKHYSDMLYALDEGVHGNMARMGSPELYQRARFGTKHLIEDFINEVCLALRDLAEVIDPSISEQEKRDFFQRASLCYGHPALLLSGGGVFGNFHAGVMRALLKEDLLPTVISGASAGSLMAAIVGTHSRDQLEQVLSPQNLLIQSGDKKSPGNKRSGLSTEWLFPRFELEAIERHIDRLVPDMTFAEAFEKTGIHINISVSPSKSRQSSRLLNVITAPRVCIRSAVLASSSVPGIYPPVQLYARDRQGRTQEYLPTRRWVDGSVSDDVPTQRLSRLYDVNHYIVSMVNPIAMMTQPVRQSASWRGDLSHFWQHTLRNAARSSQRLGDKVTKRWPTLQFNVNALMSVLLQEYSGDINILPPQGMIRILSAMRQPTEEYMVNLVDAGERAAWPHIEGIRNCGRIGRELDRILSELDVEQGHSRHRSVAKQADIHQA